MVTVPEKYHNGHEAHFTQVTENFLKYLRAGKLPDWEVPNMLTKYATIMQAYEMSRLDRSRVGIAPRRSRFFRTRIAAVQIAMRLR